MLYLFFRSEQNIIHSKTQVHRRLECISNVFSSIFVQNHFTRTCIGSFILRMWTNYYPFFLYLLFRYTTVSLFLIPFSFNKCIIIYSLYVHVYCKYLFYRYNYHFAPKEVLSLVPSLQVKFRHILFAQMCKKEKTQVKQTCEVFSNIQ